MKIAKKIGIALLVTVVGMQFYRPEKNTATEGYVAVFEVETQPGREVKRILETACYDCHSANTVYPWYNTVAPISYWLNHHIEEGKEHLDFSDWGKLPCHEKEPQTGETH